ncbi:MULTISPECIES: ankyrin repeat domain-containing protein [unclassified Candidatus Cardinium]|uniref:ankyrin repeat domain-containing protein n=1 Tax=unclassified Candidatus Cardinium TaxID=2641185 RepID=UPI001FB4B366|nr:MULTISPECIES: ankyrin repeat domain-containing protein [unclassified Candidatus Cardinium]
MKQLYLPLHGFRSMLILFSLLLEIGCLKHSNKLFAISKHLTDKGIDVTPTPLYTTIKYFNQEVFYRAVRYFHQDVVEGNLREVQNWFKYSDLFHDQYKKMFLNSILDAKTALCKAIKRGNEKMLRGLSKHSAIDINKTSKKATSLILALKDKNAKKAEAMARILLIRSFSKGLNVTASDPNTGNTPLHMAIRKGYKDLAVLLMQQPKIPLNEKNNRGNTPLHMAIRKGYKDLAVLLMQQPKILLNEKNNRGNTSLHIAICRGYKDLAVLLMQQPKILLNEKNNRGNTPLHMAIRRGYKDLAALFMKQGKYQLRTVVKLTYQKQEPAQSVAIKREDVVHKADTMP